MLLEMATFKDKGKVRGLNKRPRSVVLGKTGKSDLETKGILRALPLVTLAQDKASNCPCLWEHGGHW